MKRDRFGSLHSDGIPYARGKILTCTEDDLAKLVGAGGNADTEGRTIPADAAG